MILSSLYHDEAHLVPVEREEGTRYDLLLVLAAKPPVTNNGMRHELTSFIRSDVGTGGADGSGVATALS